MSSPVVLMGLLVEYGKDLGFSEQQAAVFFATMVPFSLLGKIVVGGLADVAPLKPSIAMIVVGLLFMSHGLSKLIGWPTPMPEGAPPAIVYSAGPIEAITGALVAAGLFTRWAAFIASGQMAVAYWLGHGTKAFLPITNQGELAVLYCFVFLFIAAPGPGIRSVDPARERFTGDFAAEANKLARGSYRKPFVVSEAIS